MRYEVRAVLAGAYRGKDVGQRMLLLHVLLIDEQDHEADTTLCGRVDNENLSDLPMNTPPTCPLCVKRLARLS